MNEAEELARLRAERKELIAVVKGLAHALNSARLIMSDKEARAYAAELVNAAQMLVVKAEGACTA